jgi:hypothetical protein
MGLRDSMKGLTLVARSREPEFAVSEGPTVCEGNRDASELRGQQSQNERGRRG